MFEISSGQVVNSLMVRAQVKSEPSASELGSGDSVRPSSREGLHSGLPSVSVSSRIVLPLSPSPSSYHYGSGHLSLGIGQHGTGSGRSSSNSGTGSPHSTPPPSIGSSQSDASACSSVLASQFVKKEPYVSSTVPSHLGFVGQKPQHDMSHPSLLTVNGGRGVSGGDSPVNSVNSDKNLNANNVGGNTRDSVDNTVASSSEGRVRLTTPDSLTSGSSIFLSEKISSARVNTSGSLAVSTSTSNIVSKTDEKRINNNTSSYSCGRLKFYKGNFVLINNNSMV